MKTILALALLVPFALQAKEITSANTLKVISPDGLTSIKDISAKLSVACKYKSGIFWPENKSCGYKTIDLEVKDGVISIPAVETFPGPYLRNQLTKNYDISLSVSEGDKYLATLTVYNEDAFKKFSENKKPLSVYRFKGATFGASHDGQDFFGSELSKDKDGYLLLSVSPSVVEETIFDILVSSSGDRYLWSAENRGSLSGRTQLKDLKEIDMPDTIVAFLGEAQDLKLNVRLNFLINTGPKGLQLEAKASVKAKPDALSEIGTLELK